MFWVASPQPEEEDGPEHWKSKTRYLADVRPTRRFPCAPRPRASRIRAPEVSVVGKGGAGAETAATDVGPFAVRARSAHAGLALLAVKQSDRTDLGEFFRGRGIATLPDLGEGRLFHIAKRDVLPELVGVNVALGVDVGDAAAGAVGASTVPREQAAGLGEVRIGLPFSILTNKYAPSAGWVTVSNSRVTPCSCHASTREINEIEWGQSSREWGQSSRINI